jgi:NADH-quinone oxidoreductase subunit J
VNIEALLFALFAILSIVSAGLVVLIRDPVKAAMSLIVCFFCIACLYLLQSAELIGVLEVIVYAGAIMVLFVFVIMLVEHKDEAIVSHQLSQRVAVPLKVLACATVAASVVLFIHRGAELLTSDVLPAGFGSVRSVGREFFHAFLFHFEFTSLLLLVGIVGAVVISKRARKAMPGDREEPAMIHPSAHAPPPLPRGESEVGGGA